MEAESFPLAGRGRQACVGVQNVKAPPFVGRSSNRHPTSRALSSGSHFIGLIIPSNFFFTVISVNYGIRLSYRLKQQLLICVLFLRHPTWCRADSPDKLNELKSEKGQPGIHFGSRSPATYVP
jgi:hypothetical protein